MIKLMLSHAKVTGLHSFVLIFAVQRICHSPKTELQEGLQFFFSAHPLIMPYICTQIHDKILNSFSSYSVDKNIAYNKQRGIIT